MYGPILSFVLVVSKFRITHGEFLRGREYPVGFSLKRGWLIMNVIAKKRKLRQTSPMASGVCVGTCYMCACRWGIYLMM